MINDRPDLAALRDRGAIPTTMQLTPAPFQPPALEDLEAPRRQTSMDGEAIKIVIHDVDSGPICASKRRVILRRDPSDKAHRSKCVNFFFFITAIKLIVLLEKCNIQNGHFFILPLVTLLLKKTTQN